ncbi:hypothetical protein D3C87_637270 [compost metagenome]
MTYAIGEFKFGINLREYHDMGLSEEIIEAIEEFNDAEILQSSYSGSGDMPLYLGAHITDIDECGDMAWHEIENLKNTLKAAQEPDSSQNKEYREKLQVILDAPDVSDAVKEWFKAQKPEVFLTWATS